MKFIILLVLLTVLAAVNAYNITDSNVKGLEAGFEPELESTGGYSGFDISQKLSSSTASCLASSGYTFGIVRGYQSNGVVDVNVCSSLKEMSAFKRKDVYLFPDPKSTKPASNQMGELVNYLNANCKSSWSGRVWLDVEGSQYWLGDASKNQAWYNQLVSSCATHGVSCGVYASSYQWSTLFGSTSYKNPVSGMPLWYAHYDGSPSFSGNIKAYLTLYFVTIGFNPNYHY